jgi:hypothetical protein
MKPLNHRPMDLLFPSGPACCWLCLGKINSHYELVNGCVDARPVKAAALHQYRRDPSESLMDMPNSHGSVVLMAR